MYEEEEHAIREWYAKEIELHSQIFWRKKSAE